MSYLWEMLETFQKCLHCTTAGLITIVCPARPLGLNSRLVYPSAQLAFSPQLIVLQFSTSQPKCHDTSLDSPLISNLTPNPGDSAFKVYFEQFTIVGLVETSISLACSSMTAS
jgi:hypothetical protein